jgi:hypothetical protein
VCLELNTGMIIDGALNVAGVSCNGNMGVTGNLTVGSGVIFIQPDANAYTLQIGRFSAAFPNAYIACHPSDTDYGFQFRTRSGSAGVNVGEITKDGLGILPSTAQVADYRLVQTLKFTEMRLMYFEHQTHLK